MDEKEVKKRVVELRRAFENVSAEREFLRKQAQRIQELAQQLEQACAMYAGQSNISSEQAEVLEFPKNT